MYVFVYDVHIKTASTHMCVLHTYLPCVYIALMDIQYNCGQAPIQASGLQQVCGCVWATVGATHMYYVL